MKNIMKFYAILFITVWILMIIYPDLVGIILGIFLIFIWLNIFFISKLTSNFKAWFQAKTGDKKDMKDYVKFGSYKIFK